MLLRDLSSSVRLLQQKMNSWLCTFISWSYYPRQYQYPKLKGFGFIAKEREVSFTERSKVVEMGKVIQIIHQLFSFDELISE